MTCEHGYIERQNADMDGMCVLCAKAEIERLRAALTKIANPPKLEYEDDYDLGYLSGRWETAKEIAREALGVNEQQTNDKDWAKAAANVAKQTPDAFIDALRSTEQSSVNICPKCKSENWPAQGYELGKEILYCPDCGYCER